MLPTESHRTSKSNFQNPCTVWHFQVTDWFLTFGAIGSYLWRTAPVAWEILGVGILQLLFVMENSAPNHNQELSVYHRLMPGDLGFRQCQGRCSRQILYVETIHFKTAKIVERISYFKNWYNSLNCQAKSGTQQFTASSNRDSKPDELSPWHLVTAPLYSCPSTSPGLKYINFGKSLSWQFQRECHNSCRKSTSGKSIAANSTFVWYV